MKLFIYLLIFIVGLISVNALQICEPPLSVGEECVLLTPSIFCIGTYDYDIYNESGNIVESGNLTLLNDTIYGFNVSLPSGEYIVKLCDDSTRELIVGGKKMIMATIVGLIGLIFLMFYISINLSEDFKYLKVFFVFTGIGLMILIPASLITISGTALTFYRAFITIFSVMWSMIFVYVIYFTFKIMNLLPKNKRGGGND